MLTLFRINTYSAPFKYPYYLYIGSKMMLQIKNSLYYRLIY